MLKISKPAAVLALAIAIALSGCAASSGGTSTVTLAQTKSPVQLLRNDVIDRIEQRFVAEVRPTTDESVACLDQGENPDGLIRQWQSGGEIVLASDADVSYVTERLVQGLTGKGWEAKVISDAAPITQTELTSSHSLATVDITSEQHDDGSVIKIVSTGPCVKTAGPDSDEVKSLES